MLKKILCSLVCCLIIALTMGVRCYAATYTIKNSHPRIWLTDERLARMQQDAGNNTEYYQEFIRGSSKWSSVKFQNVLNFMLRYKLTGDEAYAQYAMDIADGFLSQKYADRWKAGDYMLAMALVYDWLYDHPKMNNLADHDGIQTRKQAYLKWLMYPDTSYPSDNFYYPSQYQRAYKIDGSGFYPNTGQSWHNYHNWGMLDLFIMGVVLHGEPGGDQAQSWIDEALTWYSRTKEGLLFNGAGGGSPEGDVYWQETICYLTRFLLAYESATGQSLASELSYYRDRLQYGLYNLVHTQIPTFDGPAYWTYLDGDANKNINYSNHLGRLSKWMLIELFPDDPNAKIMQDYLLNMPVHRTYNYKWAGEEFLWADINRYNLGSSTFPTINHGKLDLSVSAPGTGRVFIRENWTEGGTHIGFQCGDHFEYHQHYHQGHFSLFKLDDLLVDSGKYESTYDEHARNYYYRTIAHNTLVVYDDREGSGAVEGGGAWVDMRGSREGINDGGQLVNAIYTENGVKIKEGEESVFTVADWQDYEEIYDSGDLVHYEDTGDYVFTQGNATKAYHNWKVSHFDRSLVYLREHDALLVYDRVSVPQAANKKRMLFHFQGEPQLTTDQHTQETKLHGLGNPYGGVWRYTGTNSLEVTNGEGKLFFTSLLPSTPEIAKIGGADTQGDYDTQGSYDYWVPHDGNNLETGGTNHYEQGDDSDAPNGLWRVEVSPSIAAVDDEFLTVLHPRSSQISSVPAPKLVQVLQGTMSGAVLDEAAHPYLVLFSTESDGDFSESVHYVSNYGSGLAGKHLLVGIASGLYDVYKNGTKMISTLATSSENTLSFEITGGGSFELVRVGDIPSIQTSFSIINYMPTILVSRQR